MFGLYILISFALEYENKAFKFGMSMRLEERWYDYSDSESDPRYHCIFKINDKLTDKNVKFLEGKILKKTDKYRKKKKGNEYRDTTKISYEDFIKIAEKVLKFYGINYKIEYEPVFEKPKRMIKENTGDIEEEELFKIDESQPITPPDSPPNSPPISPNYEPEPEPQIITLRNDVQIESNKIFNYLLRKNKYFQGIYYIATGIGKTYIAFKNCLDHLALHPNDNILWITYKNEIVNSQNHELLGDKVIKCNGETFDPDFINRQRGKIIILLRQGLIHNYKKLNKNLIQGIVYDECQDACKVSTEKEILKDNEITNKIDGKTYVMMKFFEENNDLKYRTGYSATPLTSNIKQNSGLFELYGDKNTNKINYLYTCSLLDGVAKGLILKPNIEYNPINGITELFKDFKPERNIEIINEIFKYIDSVIDNDILIYKKIVLWFPSIDISVYFYENYKSKIKKFISNSHKDYKDNNHENIFKDVKNNALMFACDKFTTGFDSINLEAGINFILNEQGYMTVQKLGRFSRFKESQDTAYLFQIIDNNNNEDALIDNLIKCSEGLGISIDEIIRYIKFKNRSPNSSINDTKEVQGIFNLEKHKLTYDMLINKIDFKSSKDTTNNKIKRFIRKYNEDKDIKDCIVCEKDIQKFLNNHHWSKKFGELEMSQNIIEYCLSSNKLESIRNKLYNKSEFKEVCKDKITSINYKEFENDLRLPPWEYVENGLYDGEVFITIMEETVIDIDGF